MLIALYLITSIICIARYKINISVLYIYIGLIFILGIFVYDDIQIIKYLERALIANIFIIIGYMAGTYFKKESSTTNVATYNIRSIVIFFWITVFIVCVHYSILGIPFFSPDIGILRFSQIGSGYAGIPSRFAVYMPILMFVILGLCSSKFGISRKQQILFFSFVVIALIAQGNKSSLLQVIFLGIVIYPQSTLKEEFLKYSVFVLLMSILFAFSTFTKINILEDWNLYDYIVARYTTIMHSTGYLLTTLNYTDFLFIYNNPLINDLFYPLFRVFTTQVVTLNAQLSRYFYGVYYLDSFSVPVTPGWYSYHFFLFGSSKITYFFSFLFGLLNAFIENWGKNTSNFLKKTSSIFILYWLYIGYTTGNLYYLIVNVFFSLTMLYVIYTVSDSLGKKKI